MDDSGGGGECITTVGIWIGHGVGNGISDGVLLPRKGGLGSEKK